MDVPSSLLNTLDIEAALLEEIEYPLPYLPPSIMTRAVAPRVAEAAAYFTGLYRKEIDVAQAEIVQVRKSGNGLRPVAVVDFPTRVLFRALCNHLAPHLEPLDRSWNAKQRSEREPLESGPSHIVIADVTAFYDFVDHAILEEELIAQTGEAEVVEVIVTLLRNVMGRKFGLPQVLYPSNVLSEIYIDIAERRLVRSGFSVWRYIDDFRLTATTWRNANDALDGLNSVIRDLGLTLNENKLHVLTAEVYRDWLEKPDRIWRTITEEVKIDLRPGDGYMEDTEAEGDIPDEELRAAAAPKALELALTDPSTDRLEQSVNRLLARSALYSLTRVRSESALPQIVSLMRREPQLSADVARYLRAAAGVNESNVAATCSLVIGDPGVHLSDWQSLWLLEAIRELNELPADIGKWISAIVSGNGPDIVRARAALTLAESEAISFEEIAELYGTVVPASRPDTIAAAALVAQADDPRLRTIERDTKPNSWIVELTRNEH